MTLLWVGFPQLGQAVEVRLNAFGDISAAAEHGDYASEDDRETWEAHGFDQEPVSTNRGLQISGTDFVVTADIDENLVYQSEINFQVCRGCTDEIEVDFERMYLDYSVHPLLGLQAGLFFTPIGYVNRNLYARGWLMNSIQVRDIVEEELELVPTHMVGAVVHGDLQLSSKSFLMYALGVGNGRRSEPIGTTYARDSNSSNVVTVLFEYRNEGFKNFRIGLSGWADRIRTTLVGPEYGDGAIAGANGQDQGLILNEQGFNPYIVFDGSGFGLLAEYHIATLEDDNPDGERLEDNGWESSKFELTGITVEASLSFMDGRLHPYVRYDETDLPDENGGPYYGIRAGDSGAVHTYVPEMKAYMLGVAYDLFTFNRIKLEYIDHLDGPRKDGFALQSAFAF